MQSAATGTVLAISTATLTLSVTLVVLIYLDPILFAASIALVPVTLLLARRFARPVRTAARSIREENAINRRPADQNKELIYESASHSQISSLSVVSSRGQ